MVYCQNCGTNLDTNPNFYPNCGIALHKASAEQVNYNEQTNNRQWSNTAKTVGTIAGVAAGASLLSGLFRRHRRRPPMPPHGGHGPMSGPGGHR